MVIVPQASLPEPVKLVGPRPEDILESGGQHGGILPHGGVLQLDGTQFEPVGIDPFQVDYANQLVQPMDSPNFNLDYNQQVSVHWLISDITIYHPTPTTTPASMCC